MLYSSSSAPRRILNFFVAHLPRQSMRRWRWLQLQPVLFRWPIKTTIFGFVLLGVLYPDPVLFVRHLQNLRQVNQLPDASGDLGVVSTEFDQYLRDSQIDVHNQAALLGAAEKFVYKRIPYAWDWDSWGVADYMPTVDEVVAKGREDCDGRAILAAALLRQRGIDARLEGDPRHIWVTTPLGALMQPLGPAVVRFDDSGMQVRWSELLNLGPMAFGISVFPFGREIIILMTLWALLLPAGVPRMQALFSFMLLLGALLVLRFAGADARFPQYGHMLLGGSLILGAWCVLRPRAMFENIPFGRSVIGVLDGSG
jgi:hypothetical protein